MSALIATRFIPTRQPTDRTWTVSLVTALRVALRTHLTRKALPEMTGRELSDIGLTRHSALAEAARLPWDTTPGPRRRSPQGVIGHIQQAWHRARTRQLLAQMTAQELRDIGITQVEAETEANKPFWRC